jgi:hypothetical protein
LSVLRPLRVLAVLFLVGCQQQHDAPPAATSTGSAASGSPVARATHAPAPKPINKAVLDAGGVTFASSAGKTEEFAFGTPREAVDKVAERFFGPADERSDNAECGAGPMAFSRYGPLTLNFQDDKLVGWLAREGPQVVTSDGIRPGTRMRDLKVARSARMIPDSTLEGEFDYLAADGHSIGGFAVGEGRDAKIDSLYAGVNCFFR